MNWQEVAKLLRDTVAYSDVPIVVINLDENRGRAMSAIGDAGIFADDEENDTVKNASWRTVN